MDTFNTIVTALGGAGALSGLVTAIVSYIKSKTAANERKAEAHKDHEVHRAKVDALQRSIDALGANLTAAQTSEAAMRGERDALREDNAAKDKKIAQLEKTNMQLAAALPPAVKPVKPKD